MIERVICASCAGDKSYFCFSDLGRNEFWEDPYAKLQRFTVFDATHANRWALSEIDIALVSICRFTYPDRDRSIFVGLSFEGDVAFIGKEEGFYERIDGAGLDADDSQGVGSMSAIRQIGHRLYAIGSKGQIYRREALQDWRHLDEGVLLARQEQSAGERQLSSINGLREDSIYVAGIDGSIFWYDGRSWAPVHCPTIEWLKAIAIEDEKTVWICGKNGTLLRGNAKEGFHDVSGLGDSENFLSVAFFEGKVYLAHEKGVCVFDGATISPVMTGLTPELSDGRALDTVDGVLWSFGYGDIAQFDGMKWMRFPTNPDTDRKR